MTLHRARKMPRWAPALPSSPSSSSSSSSSSPSSSSSSSSSSSPSPSCQSPSHSPHSPGWCLKTSFFSLHQSRSPSTPHGQNPGPPVRPRAFSQLNRVLLVLVVLCTPWETQALPTSHQTTPPVPQVPAGPHASSSRDWTPLGDGATPGDDDDDDDDGDTHPWGDGQPSGHVYGTLVHGRVSRIPELLGLVEPSHKDDNCTDCPNSEDTARRTFEDLKREQLKREILKALRLPKPPNVSRAAAESAITKPVKRFLRREREELRQNHQERFKNSNYAKITEIVSYGEEAANFSDSATVMFRLSTSAADPSSSLKVMSASLFMLLRYRKGRSGGAEGIKPHRRVKVNIYPVYPGQNPADLEADANKTMFGSLGVMVRHTRWQKLILPVSEIQKVLDSRTKVLHLRITCDNCGSDIEPVLAARRHHHASHQGRRKVRAGGKRNVNKRRPLLIVHTAVENAPTSGFSETSGADTYGSDTYGPDSSDDAQTGSDATHMIRKRRLAPARPNREVRRRKHRKRNCAAEAAWSSSSASSSSSGKSLCRQRKLWVSFKDFGWDDWILYPEGYWANICEGSCPAAPYRPLGGLKGGRHPFYRSHAIRTRDEQKGGSARHPSHQFQYKAHPKPWRGVADTCCTPRRMSGLHLIYFDENGNIVKTLLRDMVVDRCGCA